VTTACWRADDFSPFSPLTPALSPQRGEGVAPLLLRYPEGSIGRPRLGGFQQAIKKTVHFILGFVIEVEPDWTAHERIVEDPLAHEQMLFYCQESIETGLHGDKGRQRTVDAIGGRRVPSS